MILEIVKYGNPVLRAKGVRIGEITDELKQLGADMIETMHAANGVGLAAQQIGQALQIAVVDVHDEEDRPSAMYIGDEEVDLEQYMPMVLINPELTLSKEKESGKEGCLSFPDITGAITRSVGVVCKTRLIDGTELEFEAVGLLARALQHEVDHLNGVLFIDRMNSATKVSLANRLKRMQRGED